MLEFDHASRQLYGRPFETILIIGILLPKERILIGPPRHVFFSAAGSDSERNGAAAGACGPACGGLEIPAAAAAMHRVPMERTGTSSIAKKKYSPQSTCTICICCAGGDGESQDR